MVISPFKSLITDGMVGYIMYRLRWRWRIADHCGSVSNINDSMDGSIYYLLVGVVANFTGWLWQCF